MTERLQVFALNSRLKAEGLGLVQGAEETDPCDIDHTRLRRLHRYNGTGMS